MAIRKVGVLGFGLMGSGIAEVAAKAGFEVVVREVDRALLDKGMGRLRGSLDKAVEKGNLPAAERDAALARLRGTTEVADLAGCDLVDEAIIENVEEKKKAYAEVGAVAGPDVILASNTPRPMGRTPLAKHPRTPEHRFQLPALLHHRAARLRGHADHGAVAGRRAGNHEARHRRRDAAPQPPVRRPADGDLGWGNPPTLRKGKRLFQWFNPQLA